MTFFDLRALRSEKNYSKISHPKMSLGTENTAATPTTREPEQAEEPTNGISHDLIKERIRANLNPLNDQISRLTQVLKQLIQEISARNIPAADTVESLTQS